ncbi:hypothetical protein EG328_008785 [Venturia inaequalis]|uniref:F-box domain-containing protein n=1 Tax=Venturia inaequalis TaxID=5025 RepID=A0A8H3UBL1_VENIN|nr:hypothetical protein EG328_008785 [Venturia inaequalis]RDI78577.1 hypothetical protein Vi05172_g11538 [Venturia inaequalis]
MAVMESVVPSSYKILTRKSCVGRRKDAPSLTAIPGELRNKICDFLFDISFPSQDDVAKLNNNHLSSHFNLLLCSQQLRREQLEKLFTIDRFFQDFEALNVWICKGVAINPEFLPRVRHVGIHTGRKRRRQECTIAYSDFHVQEAFSKLPGLQTLHISSSFTLKSFVMNTEEVSQIMVSISKMCPHLERLAFLVPSENLDFLYNLPKLQVLAITTPTFFDAEHFLSAVSSLSHLSTFRIRDKGCSSAFTPSILSQMPPLNEIQLKDDMTPGRVVVPEMMNVLLERHGATVTSLHLEVSKFGREGTLESIFATLPQLPRLSKLKLWFDSDHREEEALNSLLTTLSLLHKINDLHLCFKLPEHEISELAYQKIMNTLRFKGADRWVGEYWTNEEGYVLDDGHSHWVRDGNAARKDGFYGATWPATGKETLSGRGRYYGYVQVRAWKKEW